MQKLEANFIDNHVSFVYEEVCREAIWSLAAQGLWPFAIDKVGRWRDRNNEIDVVALGSATQSALFGECEFWKDKAGVNILRELEQKATAVEWNRAERHAHYALLSISGFTEELAELARLREDVTLLS